MKLLFVLTGILLAVVQSSGNLYSQKKYVSSGDLILTRDNPQVNQRYVSAGNRAYITGMLDGNFPPQGWHIVDEMGGVWIPPLKAVDGLWMKINGQYVTSAQKYIRTAAWSEFEFKSDGLQINRKDIALDKQPGVLFIYSISNESSEIKDLTIELTARFHPIQSYPFVQGDEDYRRNKQAFEFQTNVKYDSSFSGITVSTNKYKRFAALKSNIKPDAFSSKKQTDLPIPESKSFFQDSEADGSIRLKIQIGADSEEKLIIAITGSNSSLNEAKNSADEILKNADNLSKEKKRKYTDLANRTFLETPDNTINTAFLWNKLNMAMQIITVPSIGTGAVAGYPDYPWYFGNDGSFSVPALLAIGQAEAAKEHLRLLADVSNRVNESSGKIVHEIVTDGTVYWGKNDDPGNTNETCQFAKAVGQVWKWTGDASFLKELYPTVKRGMLKWLLESQIAEGDIFPIGYGNAEVLGWGLKRLDVQCYAVEGLLSFADMAAHFDESGFEKTARNWAAKIRNGINEIWWMEEKGYYANSLTKENVPVMLGEISPVPLEAQVADSAKAAILIDSIKSSGEKNEYGWGEMSIGSGWAAMALANYNKTDEALHFIKGIANLWNVEMPGGLPEHNPPYTLNPQHTQWQTNAVQLWGGYGLHYPLINKILGIDPDIPRNKIRIISNLPESWSKVECYNLIVGKDTLDIIVTRDQNHLRIKIDYTGEENLEIGSIIPASTNIKGITLNEAAQPKDELIQSYVFGGKEVFIRTEDQKVEMKLTLD